jgi:tRNA A37 methylthiotransferase MiaB
MANPKGLHGVREELARVFAEHDELYNFIHAPVQSGSDDVLADMRRQHAVSEYLEVVETLDDQLDYWTLSTDFIVGFPTEEPADHEQSMALLRETRPEKINVTRFSKRPGTDADDMKGLGGQIKKDRSKEMSEAKMELMAEAYEEMVGHTSSVLLVEDGTDESLVGYDEAYRQVVIADAQERGLEIGDTVDVEITSHNTVYAFGEPIERAQIAD